MEQETPEGDHSSRHWPSALALFGIVMVTALFAQPGVVIGVPLGLLLVASGFRSVVSMAVAGLVVLIVAGGRGAGDPGLWYAERAWAVLLGGWFLALTLRWPAWRLTSRALAAVGGAAGVAAGLFAARIGSWSRLDDAVSRGMLADVDATLDFLTGVGGGDALSPDMISLATEVAAAQVSVFPALLAVESLAALGVAWWARARLLNEQDPGLAPLRDFRFNDHLVWLLVTGLVLLVLQPGSMLARVGSNLLVLMGALYALRGVAVFVFISGGVSVLGSLVFVALLVLVPPVVFATAALIGVGDTWLDLRTRLSEEAA
jgi:hypothetical protein